MEIQGKVIAVLEEVNGTSQRTGNQWRKNQFVIETHDQYPKKSAFDVWNDLVDKIPAVGTEVNVYFDIEANEWKGKYFNELRAYKIETAGDAALNNAVQAQAVQAQTVQAQPQQEALPF